VVDDIHAWQGDITWHWWLKILNFFSNLCRQAPIFGWVIQPNFQRFRHSEPTESLRWRTFWTICPPQPLPRWRAVTGVWQECCSITWRLWAWLILARLKLCSHYAVSCGETWFPIWGYISGLTQTIELQIASAILAGRFQSSEGLLSQVSRDFGILSFPSTWRAYCPNLKWRVFVTTCPPWHLPMLRAGAGVWHWWE
jgi:hypothetical protein